jgi:hypothetical protein
MFLKGVTAIQSAKTILVAVSMCWLFQPKAAAELGEDWSYERLFKKADLVVIARPTANERRSERLVLKDQQVTLGRVVSTFSINHRLKSNCEEKIKVFHFEVIEFHNTFPLGSPSLVQFRDKSIKANVGSSILGLPPPEYLLFLKKRSDGNYELVSGDYHSSLSVRELTAPFEFGPKGAPVRDPDKK